MQPGLGGLDFAADGCKNLVTVNFLPTAWLQTHKPDTAIAGPRKRSEL